MHCVPTAMRRKPPRSPSPVRSSTACSISDARSPSASREPQPGKGSPRPAGPPCNMLTERFLQKPCDNCPDVAPTYYDYNDIVIGIKEKGRTVVIEIMRVLPVMP